MLAEYIYNKFVKSLTISKCEKCKYYREKTNITGYCLIKHDDKNKNIIVECDYICDNYKEFDKL
jgi:hypothetical protein